MTGTATHSATDTANATIHRTAELGPEVTFGRGVTVGPRCTVEGRVHLGDGVHLIGEVYIQGPATIGAGTTIYPFAVLGTPPQDRKFAIGDPSAGISVGRECILREHFTMHAATKTDTPTNVGDRCMCMVNSHLGHDVSVGNDVILVNNVAIGGHARIDDRANLSAAVLVHQFGRVGTLAMVSGGVAVAADVPPFCMSGERNRVSGLNRIGLRRSGMSREEINRVAQAFRAIYTKHIQRDELIAILAEMSAGSPAVTEMHRWFSDPAGKRSYAEGPSRLPRWFTNWMRTRRQHDALDAEAAEEAGARDAFGASPGNADENPAG